MHLQDGWVLRDVVQPALSRVGHVRREERRWSAASGAGGCEDLDARVALKFRWLRSRSR
jgi:hypothetical protein